MWCGALHTGHSQILSAELGKETVIVFPGQGTLPHAPGRKVVQKEFACALKAGDRDVGVGK